MAYRALIPCMYDERAKKSETAEQLEGRKHNRVSGRQRGSQAKRQPNRAGAKLRGSQTEGGPKQRVSEAAGQQGGDTAK